MIQTNDPERSQKRPKKALKTPGASEYTDTPQSTLEKLRCTGGGPAFIRRGRTILYPIESLNSWLESFPRFKNTSEADVAREAKKGAAP